MICKDKTMCKVIEDKFNSNILYKEMNKEQRKISIIIINSLLMNDENYLINKLVGFRNNIIYGTLGCLDIFGCIEWDNKFINVETLYKHITLKDYNLKNLKDVLIEI